MRKFVFFSLFGLFFISSFAAAANLKIGYIDTERLFKESPMAVDAQKELQKEFAQRDQHIKDMVAKARNMQNALEKEGMTMSASDKANKEHDLAALTLKVQQAQRDFREDLNQRKQEEFNAIQERARSIILKIAHKDKYDLILENVIYASPKVNLTDRVLKAMAKKH